MIPDQPGGLDKLTQLLFAEGININNAYGFVLDAGRGGLRRQVDEWKRPKS